MKTQWEYDLVEKPFCEQLQRMGWQWIEGDPDLPETTERSSSREVLLKGRLASALKRLNLRDGRPWLDDARIAHAIRDLEQAAGHRLMEINQAATELLLKGTVAEGLPNWEQGRPQPVRFIDFDNLANNDFLVINQFKVELTSGRGHVIPDTVLFVNGIPLVVAEFKSPGIQSPLQEAINQLLRYSNQRRELFPTLYTESEGVERLFHTNQLLIASDFFEARAATIGAPPEAYLEWADTSPVPMSTVAEELGVLPASPEVDEAAQELAALGPQQADWVGTPLFFRKPEQRPAALRGSLTLQSQQILAAGMLRPSHLLDLIRNFTLFQQVEGKTRKVARTTSSSAPSTRQWLGSRRGAHACRVLSAISVAEKVKALINAHIAARGVDPKIPPTTITDAQFEKVLAAQSSSRARAAQMQHAARFHIVGFSNQNPAYARKMSEKLEEILQRFKDDWDALERELRKFINELRQGDRYEFPDLDPRAQVPFVHLVLEECGKNRELTVEQRGNALAATLEMVERIRQEIRKVGFWKNPAMRELLTRTLVRDLDATGICRPGSERDIAQRLVALAKENHEVLTRT